MLAPNLPMTATTKAAAYFRMSSDEQAGSIEQQRAAIKKFAAEKGFQIVEEYSDEGRSGSRYQSKRTELARLLEDGEAGKFRAVLCWDVSRFSRQDSIDANEAKARLRKHGIVLETVTQGRVDWDTFGGRVADTLLQEAAHEYARSLGKNSVRGRVAKLKAGWWPHGGLPYGYKRAIYTESGRLDRVVSRAEEFRKPRGYTVKLVPDEGEAEIVRWVFKEFTTRDTSMRCLAREADAKAPAPMGKGKWLPWTIKYILQNPIYVGDALIGHARKKKEAFTRAEQQSHADAFTPLVDRTTFEAAKAKLRRNSEQCRKPRGNAKSIFVGLVYCQCGRRMCRRQATGKPAYFVCVNSVRKPPEGCPTWTLRESMLYRTLNHLADLIDAEICKPKKAKATGRASEIARLKADEAALINRIATGEERYLTAPEASVNGLRAKLEQWNGELTALRDRIAEASAADATEDNRQEAVAWWKEERKGFVRLLSLENDENEVWVEADKAREMLQRLGVKIAIQFDAAKRGHHRAGRMKFSAGFKATLVRPDWPGNLVRVPSDTAHIAIPGLAPEECCSGSAPRTGRRP